MHRSIVIPALLLAACVSGPPDDEVAAPPAALTGTNLTRQHLAGDVYEYGFSLRVGTGPNAVLRIHRVVRERAPWLPRPTTGGVLAMHGDFATFDSNFVPDGSGVAVWLAQRGIDVWGLDRRWTQAPEPGADLSDFDTMDLGQELADIRTALGFARGVRAVTSGSLDKMTLIGFSRGGELAYFYASDEATRPAWQRHVKGLVPLDVYVSLAPEDEDLRQFFCGLAADEYDLLADGWVDVPNDFQITLGQLALDAPDDPNPFFDGLTNRDAMLLLVAQTYFFFPASPVYHLNGAELVDDIPTGLRFSPEDTVSRWLAAAPPHQSMRESADTDALTCGDAPLPYDLPLSRIEVPLLLIGAAGGYGVHAVHSTTQVGSTDVTTRIIRQLPPEQEAEDFGHADLLFSPDAPALAWDPLLTWLRAH